METLMCPGARKERLGVFADISHADGRLLLGLRKGRREDQKK